MSLLAVPIAFVLLRRLPDRGYLLAKPLGLLLVCLVVWLLASYGLLAFSMHVYRRGHGRDSGGIAGPAGAELA